MTQPKLMTISYSEVYKWDTCPRQYYYRFGRNLSPVDESPAMVTGTKGHKLLQSFYESYRDGNSKEEARTLTHKRAKGLMEAEGIADVGLLQAWTLVDNYIRGTDFTSQAILIENRFLLPFSILSKDPNDAHVQIGFTPDVVFERSGGFMDVEDSKFVQKAWPESKKLRFQQAKLYQIFLQEMGYNISRSSIRFFNLATGRIVQENYQLKPGEREILIRDFVGAVKEVVQYREQTAEVKTLTRRTMNYTACQFCAFAIPCSIEAEGKSAEKTFKYFFKKSDYSYDV